jgi:hypothetical protein
MRVLTPNKRALRWAESDSCGSECDSDPKQTNGWFPRTLAIGSTLYALELNLAVSFYGVESWSDGQFLCGWVLAATPTMFSTCMLAGVN